MGPTEPLDQKQIYFCAICGGPGSTRHHLIPKAIYAYPPRTKTSGNLTIRTCPQCHSDIHYYFSHWELALQFNTEERIKTELSKRKSWKL